jgi:hypothetical protein
MGSQELTGGQPFARSLPMWQHVPAPHLPHHHDGKAWAATGHAEQLVVGLLQGGMACHLLTDRSLGLGQVGLQRTDQPFQSGEHGRMAIGMLALLLVPTGYQGFRFRAGGSTPRRAPGGAYLPPAIIAPLDIV